MIKTYCLDKITHKMYELKIPLIPSLIKLVIFSLYNSVIPYQCIIKKGSRFRYGGIGGVIHKRVIIGQNCNIGPKVTIGGKSPHYKVPVIGDNVYIATGAKIIEPINIGDNATIGANVVVVKDIPNFPVVGGVPAKIIRHNE